MYKPSSSSNKSSKTSGFSGFGIKKDTLSDSMKAAPFQSFVASTESTLPKFQTSETEKKYLQAAGTGYTEDDLYDPLNPTDEMEPPKPKKKRKKTRWDVDDEILPTRPIDPPVRKPPPKMSSKLSSIFDDECDYQPSDNSPKGVESKKDDEYSDEDDLDKYMASIEETIEKEEEDAKKKKITAKKEKRLDVDDEDDQESYFNARKDIPLIPYPDDEDEIEYDSDGNPLPPEKSKIIVPLPSVDHSEIIYPAFNSNFYDEHEDIKSLTQLEVNGLRKVLGVKVLGAEAARPAISFVHFGFDDHLMGVIRKSEYTKPTQIQAQAVPIALSGRDIIGIAKTGSGKTAAFVWPMLVHVMAQPELKEGDGPIALICAPTRELCQQIHTECKKFGKSYNLKSVACYGGGSKWEQTKSLQQGAEIVVCTPGRLIDLIKVKATNLLRVTFLVFDEADRMFDMGFEPQVRSIANNVRPDRQCLLFSATMKKKVEWLCRDILSDPIRIVVGELGEANEDVVQAVEIMKNGHQKWKWLLSHIVEFTSGGSVLIFVTKKTNSEEVAKNLKESGYDLGLIHGDFDQFERNDILKRFKHKEFLILVATDVAARGLDIPSIKTVINYDVARDITTHTHRIGRTGRAGEKGIAYTLVTAQDTHFTADLVRNLEGANQRVPTELIDLAMKNPWFRKTRARRGNKASTKEFKPRDRPGLGHDEAAEKETSIADEEELVVGNSAGRRASRSLLTSYSMSASAFGTNRLGNLKAAFSTGYNRFAKATDSNATTMDVGVKGGKGETFDPADQPKKMEKWDN